MSEIKPRCELCHERTMTVFNINFKMVSICDKCSLAITKQEVASWRAQSMDEIDGLRDVYSALQDCGRVSCDNLTALQLLSEAIETMNYIEGRANPRKSPVSD